MKGFIGLLLTPAINRDASVSFAHQNRSHLPVKVTLEVGIAFDLRKTLVPSGGTLLALAFAAQRGWQHLMLSAYKGIDQCLNIIY